MGLPMCIITYGFKGRNFILNNVLKNFTMNKLFRWLALGSTFAALSLAAPVLAATTTTPHTLDRTCMAVAVDKRETSLASAFNTFSSLQAAALSARHATLKGAWSISLAKDRRLAIKNSWTKYRKAHHDAVVAHRYTVKDAWKQFTAARKACGGAGNADEVAGGPGDDSLANN